MKEIMAKKYFSCFWKKETGSVYYALEGGSSFMPNFKKIRFIEKLQGFTAELHICLSKHRLLIEQTFINHCGMT